jgi:hypothetical protein
MQNGADSAGVPGGVVAEDVTTRDMDATMRDLA